MVIPTYNNPATIEAVATACRQYIDPVFVIDDGSGEEAAAACARAAETDGVWLVRRAVNGGKGAAVKTGFKQAAARGFTHVLQVDGDGQHALERIPAFLAHARSMPEAFVIGYPEYDASVPKHRLIARRFTNLWVNLEVGGDDIIRDAMVGFRVYPLATAQSLPVRGERMDFDIEIAVRMAWAGVPIINLPVPVRYLAAAEGGVSHFQPLMDNLRFASLHARLCITRIMRGFARTVGLLPR